MIEPPEVHKPHLARSREERTYPEIRYGVRYREPHWPPGEYTWANYDQYAARVTWSLDDALEIQPSACLYSNLERAVELHRMTVTAENATPTFLRLYTWRIHDFCWARIKDP